MTLMGLCQKIEERERWMLSKPNLKFLASFRFGDAADHELAH